MFGKWVSEPELTKEESKSLATANITLGLIKGVKVPGREGLDMDLPDPALHQIKISVHRAIIDGTPIDQKIFNNAKKHIADKITEHSGESGNAYLAKQYTEAGVALSDLPERFISSAGIEIVK